MVFPYSFPKMLEGFFLGGKADKKEFILLLPSRNTFSTLERELSIAMLVRNLER
jgi:hypothetical protein